VRIRAVVFDLFDTLVDLDFDRLPKPELGGRKLTPSVPALHEAVRRRIEVPFDVFATPSFRVC
jgi:FMN phosphatase YigB (HAD superfamily)